MFTPFFIIFPIKYIIAISIYFLEENVHAKHQMLVLSIASYCLAQFLKDASRADFSAWDTRVYENIP